MSYLLLVKRIISNELTDEEIKKCLDVHNVTVIQHGILKIVEREIKDDYVRDKLLEYCDYMDLRFKVLGLCKIGHLSIYALKKLGYIDEYYSKYSELAKEDQQQVDMLEKAFLQK